MKKAITYISSSDDYFEIIESSPINSQISFDDNDEWIDLSIGNIVVPKGTKVIHIRESENFVEGQITVSES